MRMFAGGIGRTGDRGFPDIPSLSLREVTGLILLRAQHLKLALSIEEISACIDSLALCTFYDVRLDVVDEPSRLGRGGIFYYVEVSDYIDRLEMIDYIDWPNGKALLTHKGAQQLAIHFVCLTNWRMIRHSLLSLQRRRRRAMSQLFEHIYRWLVNRKDFQSAT